MPTWSRPRSRSSVDPANAPKPRVNHDRAADLLAFDPLLARLPSDEAAGQGTPGHAARIRATARLRLVWRLYRRVAHARHNGSEQERRPAPCNAGNCVAPRPRATSAPRIAVPCVGSSRDLEARCTSRTVRFRRSSRRNRPGSVAPFRPRPPRGREHGARCRPSCAGRRKRSSWRRCAATLALSERPAEPALAERHRGGRCYRRR